MAALTPEEREEATAELESSRRRLLEALEAVIGEQWNRRPSGGGWSIAECVEHIAAAELPLTRLFASGARAQPSEEERREIRGKDDFVRTFLRDRSKLMEAPERIRPTGKFATPEEALRSFEERRSANLDYVRRTDESLRDRYSAHPFAGMIDGYQWILFLAAHADRHTAQIQEIRKLIG